MMAVEEIPHLPILLVIGFAIFAGTVGARLFQRMRIPQVVGYIIIGLLVGQSGLKLIDEKTIKLLEPFSFFALGVIGFVIGGELRREIFQKRGRQLFAILLAEGLGPFILVSLLTGGVAMLITGKPATSAAIGLVFGAIASATAPAATVNVLWEYKTRGPLTRTVYAIVALDDALALVLFALAATVAGRLMGIDGGNGVSYALAVAAYELLGAAALGVAVGLALNFVLRRARESDKTLAFIIGAVALLIGAGRMIKVDIILAAMALGVTLVNLAPRRSHEAFEVIERFAPPIYVLFFVIVGAGIQLGSMPRWMLALVAPYAIGRVAGKVIGTSLGARWAGAAETVRKYLGLCVFCQGGVAVGLAIFAKAKFGGEVGGAFVAIVAATTFLFELVGPPAVKYAVKKAGEIGLNITEEELVASYSVADVMDDHAPAFHKDDTLGDILNTVSASDANAFPVVDNEKVIGVITINELKASFVARGVADWMVAADLMLPLRGAITAKTPLGDALARMHAEQLEFIPVVADKNDPRLAGMLELRAVNRALSQEIIRRHKLADGLA